MQLLAGNHFIVFFLHNKHTRSSQEVFGARGTATFQHMKKNRKGVVPLCVTSYQSFSSIRLKDFLLFPRKKRTITRL